MFGWLRFVAFLAIGVVIRVFYWTGFVAFWRVLVCLGGF